ncbi:MULTISPECIES: hypothetical protein [Asticcacaulis]|uniref:hypothetical protein n=1 Tax=Asticcacaulis TaxID=76890 RepID=UPI001AE1C209|nr:MULTISPECIES: hypothetical protein [Asticcacaulis]MBP2159120.1 hypothetical protein [Asticcacaulis solisilvae]MDR6800165.1 hypothetical protein [Asticcacaulis sp. BE141]
MKYYDAFGQSGFHSAFLTTFAFGSLAFEDIPLPRLRGAGCRNILVLADRVMANQASSEFGPPRFAGSSYHLIPVDAPQAFHPKIAMLVGKSKGRLMVGSANLTALGLAGNKELVTTIEWGEDEPETAGLFAAALDYIRSYAPANFPGFEMAIDRLLKNTPWLRQAVISSERHESAELSLLMDEPDRTIVDQIETLIASDEIERLTVVSPYWDAGLEGLVRLRGAMANPPIHILSTAGQPFPIEALDRVAGTKLFDLKAFKGGKFLGTRFLHAKLIIAQGKSWDHVISGSMNCTFAALLGRRAASGNAEAGIYRRLPAGTAFEILGLAGYEDFPLVPADMAPLSNALSIDISSSTALDGGRLVILDRVLTWRPPVGPDYLEAKIALYDRDDALLFRQEDQPSASTGPWVVEPESARPRYGLVQFPNGAVSAPVSVIDLDTLEASTLPSQGGRKGKLIDALQTAEDADLSLLEILNELEQLDLSDQAEEAADLTRLRVVSGDQAAGPQSRVLPYDEFVRARTEARLAGVIESPYLGSLGRAGSYLADCLNQLINLVGEDLDAAEEAELARQTLANIETTEPTDQDAEVLPDQPPDVPRTPKQEARKNQGLLTAKKIQDAVTAFEKRCRSRTVETISTSETVRARLLLQVILDHAQPIGGAAREREVLPAYIREGHDWPRLLGRTIAALSRLNVVRNLHVEPVESEQRRVIECLATADWAAKAALVAVNGNQEAGRLQALLAPVASNQRQQCDVVLSASPGDLGYFEEIQNKLRSRYTRLGV